MKIPSSVTIIDDFAFYKCCQLEEVELCEGLLEIGREAFDFCKSLKRINLPTTVRNVGSRAFADTKSLLTINLPEELESVGAYPFSRGGLLTFRTPSLFTTIPLGMVAFAESLFSLELSESVTHVESWAFLNCYSLRNLAIPPNTGIGNIYYVFCHCIDLLQLFVSTERIINELEHRFDNLPIHKMIYYQSYESVSVDQLNDATNMRSGQSRSLRSKLDPTGKQQDCLGMTPLHILACSTVQNLELYKVLIEKYPENLIAEDRWGTLPLFYAVWGNAPSEIVEYLVESYKSIYPDYEFNWTNMMGALGKAGASKNSIQKLFNIQQGSFPKQQIDWDMVLSTCSNCTSFTKLLQCSISNRTNAIGLKLLRDDIIRFTSVSIISTGQIAEFRTEVETTLSNYEAEYHKLKEATSLVELALWKKKMNDHLQGKKQRRSKKKLKIDNSSIREQCRISCGSDIVIEHMLPYLLPTLNELAVDSQQSSMDDDESNSDSSFFSIE